MKTENKIASRYIQKQAETISNIKKDVVYGIKELEKALESVKDVILVWTEPKTNNYISGEGFEAAAHIHGDINETSQDLKKAMLILADALKKAKKIEAVIR